MSTEIAPGVRDQLTLLTVPQVCELLGVHRDWLYVEVAEGRIPHIRLGRNIRFRPAELNEWITEGMKSHG